MGEGHLKTPKQLILIFKVRVTLYNLISYV